VAFAPVHLCCGNLKLKYGTLRQFSKKQYFIASTDPVDLCPKAEPSPRTKGSHLCKQVTEAKSKV
jgi:hypothetical protein